MHGSSPGNGGETTCHREMRCQPPVVPQRQKKQSEGTARENANDFSKRGQGGNPWDHPSPTKMGKEPFWWGRGGGSWCKGRESFCKSFSPPTVHSRPDGL